MKISANGFATSRADSVPPGRYHCDHLDMGPHGHQGLITVLLTDKTWECTATYRGTNSTSDVAGVEGRFPTEAEVEATVKNGTATAPRCSKRP